MDIHQSIEMHNYFYHDSIKTTEFKNERFNEFTF